jgi:prepilin-type N-terminal cleavage/methylation domain-containing protein
MRSRRARLGYTLVELMVVISIIGMSLWAAAPAFSRAFAENRAAEAVRELVRIGRRARSETAAYRRAHLVWLEPAVAGGTVSLVRGRTTSCLNEDWNAQLTLAACGDAGAPCAESVSFSDARYQGTYATEFLFEPTDGGAVTPTATALCFTPMGSVYHDQPATLSAVSLSDANNNADARGGYRFVVRMLDSAGELHGAVRRVLFPLGAPARSLQ